MQASFHGCADFIDLIFRTVADSVSACIVNMRALSAIPRLCSAKPAEQCGIIPDRCVAGTANSSKKLFHSRLCKVGSSYSTIRNLLHPCNLRNPWLNSFRSLGLTKLRVPPRDASGFEVRSLVFGVLPSVFC